jgi:hypothetical protein
MNQAKSQSKHRLCYTFFMDLSTVLPPNFTSFIVGKKINHIYLFPSHDWILSLNSKPELGWIICLDNVNPRMHIQTLLAKNTQFKDLTPHGLDQHLHNLIIQEANVDTNFRLNIKLTHSPNDLTIDFYILNIQLAPYAPRLTLLKNEVPIFDSILGWQPKQTIKPKLSRFVFDTSLDIETMHLSFLAKEFQSLIKFHYQKKVKRQSALEKDLNTHLKNLNYKSIAESIQLEPNLSWMDYPNPFNLQKPNLTFKCNFDGVNHLFRLFKKAKQGVEEVNQQIKQNKENIEKYLYNLNLLMKPNLSEIVIVQSFLVREHLISGIKPKPIQVSHESPYFIIDENMKYSFGKNSKQNDFLTFSIAKKNDIFMHIYGEPGSHLILHQTNFDHDAIIKGAQLVLALAKKISGEITYAKVGSLKRTTQIGQVIVKDAKKIKVNANPDWANQMLKMVKRY